MVFLRCEDLAKTYITHLDEYMDVIESRKLVNRVWPESPRTDANRRNESHQIVVFPV
jgi:hypothetical protein